MKKTLFAACAFLIIAGCTTNNKQNAEVKKYDLEHHFYLPELIDYLSTRTEVPYYDKETGIFWLREGIEMQGEYLLNFLTLPFEEHLKYMDEEGVDVAVLSTSAVIEDLPHDEAVYFARKTNDAVAQIMKQYPDRAMGTAALPTPYVEDAIAELERCVNELGFKYWHTHSNYIDEHLFDAKFEPLLAKAEKLNCAIYIHPTLSDDADMKGLGYLYPAAAIGFGQDVMKTVVRLIMDGTFDRHPNLKIIIGHLGEYMPFVLDRLDNRLSCIPEPAIKMKHPVSYYVKNGNILVTTSGNTSDEAFECVMKVFGIDKIMFGSDFGYESFSDQVDFVQNLDISQEEKNLVFGGNFERIFK